MMDAHAVAGFPAGRTERYNTVVNSENDQEAFRAGESWEAAIEEYHRHVESICDGMPPSVRQLAELCLHPPLGVVSLKQDGSGVSLIYSLSDRIRECPSPEDWPFSRERKYWMYDEVDAAPSLSWAFVHRILFSDGSIMEIPFVSVVVHRFPMESPDAASLAQQPA